MSFSGRIAGLSEDKKQKLNIKAQTPRTRNVISDGGERSSGQN